MHTDVNDKTVRAHTTWKETLHYIRQLGNELEQNNFPLN